MYYLQSRYYDAGVQRFISADEVELVVTSSGMYSYNLYVYCNNDPVNKADRLGLFPVHIVAGVVLGIAWAIIPRIIKDIIRGRMSNISEYIYDAISGGVAGLVTSLTGNSTLGSTIGVFVGEMASFLINYGPKLKLGNFKTVILEFTKVIVNTAIACITSLIAGKIVNRITNKSFTSSQIRNYFKNTKYLKSAFGIGSGGTTGRRI